MGHRRTSCEGKAAVFDAGCSARGPVCMSVCSSLPCERSSLCRLGPSGEVCAAAACRGRGGRRGGEGHTRECVAWGTFGGRTMSGMCRGGGEGAWEEALTRLRRAGPSRESGLAFAAFLGSLAVGSGWVQGGGEDVRESSVTATHTSSIRRARGGIHTLCVVCT